jgi:hypothetical protein
MEIVFYVLLGILGFVALAQAPILPIIRICMLPVPNKLEIIGNFLRSWIKSLITLIPDLLAPVVVPIALIFTKWEDDKLPRLFKIWDNDASINGDRRTDDPNDGLGGWTLSRISLDKNDQEAISHCYWAPGHHPRSFYARWVWLGLRNRASMLSVMLGRRIEGISEHWGGKYWTVIRIGEYYKYFELLPITSKIAIRMHCGYKIPMIPGEEKAKFISIGFSLRKGTFN